MSIIIFLVRAEDLTFYHSIYLRWHRHPHGLLNCSYDRHQFCKNWQTLTCKHYRIHFNTFCLAGFTDCGLLELHLLDTFSYVSLRDSYATIFQMDKLVFRHRVAYTFALYYTMDLNHHYTVQQTVALPIKLVYDWKTRYAFEHFYLLSRTHSSPPCSPCYQLAFNTYSYLSI